MTIRKTVITITLESDRDDDSSPIARMAHDSLVRDLRSYGYGDHRTVSGGGPVKYRFTAKEV